MLHRLRALLARLAPEADPAPAPSPVPSAAPATPDDAMLVAAAPAAAPPPAAAATNGSPSLAAADEPIAPPAIDTRAALTRAHDLLAAGKPERAIPVLEELLRHRPDVEIAAMLDELRTIRRSSKRLRQRPHDPYAHFELGRALFAQERGEEALRHLEQACRLRPTWLEPHLLRAYELHWQGRWREAEAAYEAALAIDPAHPVARRGLGAVRLGQPPDALMPLDDRPPLAPHH